MSYLEEQSATKLCERALQQRYEMSHKFENTSITIDHINPDGKKKKISPELMTRDP